MNLLKNVFKCYFMIKFALKDEKGCVTVPARKQHYWLHAKGVTFDGKQEKIRFTNRVTKLHLEKKPVEQDENAVAISNGKEILGWIGIKLSKRISILLDKDMVKIRNWKKIGGINGKSLGLLVELEETIC